MTFAGTKTRGPECGPCEECTIASDDFDRADSTNVGTDWTEDLAEWEIDTNELRGSAARAVITHNTPHPDGDAGLSRVKVTMRPDYGAASTCTGRLLTAVADTDNYLFCEATFVEDDCATIRLGARVASVESWLTDALPVSTADGDALTLYLCWEPPTGSGSSAVAGRLAVQVAGSALACLSAETDGAGDQWGLEVTAGEVLFDNWKAEYHQEDAHPTCPHCDCASVCTIFTDNFDGRSTLGCWTQTSSSASVASGILTVTGGVVADAAPATDEDAIRVVQTIRTDDTNATLRIRVGYTDEDNYLFAEIAKAGSVVTARLGKRVSAADTYLIDAETIEGLDLTAATEVELCWRPGEHLDEVEATQIRFPLDGDTLTGDNGPWTDPGNITADDEAEAQFIFSEDDESTPTLIARDFGFALPPGSTVTGIEFSAEVEYPATQSTVIDSEMIYHFGTLPDDSDNMAIGATVPDAGSNGTQEWGGSATLSGGTPEWSDINSGDFVFTMIWQTTTLPNSNLPIEVDAVTAQVWFTTPPRGPARLQLTIGGECIQEYNIVLSDNGTQVGYKAAAGTWEIDDVALGYEESTEHPTCPRCCPPPPVECGCCDNTVSSYLVNTGTPLLGSVVVDFAYSDGATCYWSWSDHVMCDGVEVLFSVLLSVSHPLASNCRWTLSIGSIQGTVVNAISAVYQLAGDPVDCDDPITVTLVGFAFTNCSEISFPGTMSFESA